MEQPQKTMVLHNKTFNGVYVENHFGATQKDF